MVTQVEETVLRAKQGKNKNYRQYKWSYASRKRFECEKSYKDLVHRRYVVK